MDPVVERILKTAKEKGFTQKQLAEKIGIHYQVITDWKKGGSSSYKRYVPDIAQILNVSAEYLHSGKDLAPLDGELSPKIVQIVSETNGMDEKELDEVLRIIQFVKTNKI